MHLITYTWVLQFLTMFRIPHPGRVGGRIFMEPVMPLMLSWVLGGNGLDRIILFHISHYYRLSYFYAVFSSQLHIWHVASCNYGNIPE